MDPLRNIPRLAELSSHLLRLPSTDRGAFSALTSIPDIQAWATAKADEHRQCALALLAIHNLAAPIHRLPTEVLEQILEQCWQDKNSLRLPHVCRLWRSILLNRPVFWADAIEDREIVVEERVVVRDEVPLIISLISRSDQRSCTIKPSFYNFPPSLAKAIIPHVSNVASLQVAVGREDLLNGLWPVLASGMPTLEDLVIQLTVTEEDLRGYNRYPIGNLPWYYGQGWRALPSLSSDALPKLSRLACPDSLIGFFGNISIRHVRAKWVDRSSQRCLTQPKTPLGPLGLHLEPFRDTLETLEITLAGIEERGYVFPEKLKLLALRYLYIMSYSKDDTSRILSWLTLPQITSIHIARVICLATDRLITQLRPTVSTVDYVYLEERERSGYFMQCFTGDVESLRVDDFDIGGISTGTVLPIFGEATPVTHLALSPNSVNGSAAWIDLYTFPHLVHLDVNVADMNTIATMLHPGLNPNRQKSKRRTKRSPTPCPRLAELVVSSPSLSCEQWETPPHSGGASVDEQFHQELAMFQEALAHRASRGAILTSLALTLLPVVTIQPDEYEEDRTSDADTAETGDMSPERSDGEECASDRGLEDDPAYTGSCETTHESTGSDETTHERTAESDAMWPSYTARQTVLERLQELVDGPVIMKFLDSAGEDVDIDECDPKA